jgi:hypothetical protein
MQRIRWRLAGDWEAADALQEAQRSARRVTERKVRDEKICSGAIT